jgi:perosamine synthetase
MNIPVCEPDIGEQEISNVMDCLKSGWISSSGKYIEEFEDKFAKYCGVKYGVACSNGTTALHLCLLALGIGKGDEVITPNFSIISTSNAIVQCGATPVFADSEMNTWNIDVREVEKKITKKTKAIMIMHTYGCPVDVMDGFKYLCEKHKLFLIEDAAEAHGAYITGGEGIMRVGSMGDVAAFSFYANKIITTGEGGMVVTNNPQLAHKLRLYRNLGFEEPRFVHNVFGYNYRMTNIQAAIGVAQLDKIATTIVHKCNTARMYDALLRGVDGITLPPRIYYGRNVYWMYGILSDKKEQLVEHLKNRGIETRPFFYPMHRQPIYQHLKIKGEYPVADRLYKHGLYLPSSPKLTLEEIQYVCDCIKEIHR